MKKWSLAERMICLDCAAKHPQFKALEEPTQMEELPCTVCGEVKLCVPNHKVGLPGMTPDDAFKMMAKMLLSPDPAMKRSS